MSEEILNGDNPALSDPQQGRATTAQNFVADLLTKQMQASQAPIMPQPEPQGVQPDPMPAIAFPQAPVAPAAAPVASGAAPVAPVAAPVAPPAPTAPVLDYATRYAPQGESTGTLDLTPLPDLPPEPQIPQTPNGQQIPNAAFAAMRSGYGQMRHMANDFRNKYNQLVEDTKKFQGEKAEFATQLNAKDQEIKSLRDELGRVDLSRSPEFQDKYDAPIRAATDEIAQVLVANGRSQEDATAFARDIILDDDRQALPAKLAELPTHVQGMIMYKVKAADQLWNARAQALENWRQSAEGLAAVAARGSAIVDAQRVQKLADTAIGLVKSLPPEKGLPPAFQVTEPGFVADRDSKEQQFRSWVQNAPEDQKMAAMFEGFMAPKTYEMVDNVFKENLQLKQMLYARARVDAPPITAMRMPDPQLQPGTVTPAAPAQPPQQPTVRQNGWSMAETGTEAQQLVGQLLAGMRPQQNLPVL